LVYLCVTTIKDKNGANRTNDLNPLRYLFEQIARKHWKDLEERPDPSLVYLNTPPLARMLERHWVKRYFKRLDYHHARQDAEVESDAEGEPPPYEEPDGERAFSEVLAIHANALGSSEALSKAKVEFSRMLLQYKQIEWLDQ
jgi:hypothetical protein